MKRVVLAMLFIAPLSAVAGVSENACYPLVGQIGSSSGATYIAETVELNDSIETIGPLFVPVSQEFEITADKPFYCDNVADPEDAASCLWDYYNSNNASQYAWWEVSDFGQATHISGFTGTRRLDHTFYARGKRLIAGVIANDYYTVGVNDPMNPAFQNDRIPVCEGIEVYAQSMPSGTASVGGGPSVTGTVSPSIDTAYSKFGVANEDALISWRLVHDRYHEATYTITSRSTNLNFYPEYRGLYAVYVTISDGTYEHSFRAGDALFTGGMETCFSCDDNDIP